jgi:hypothetical protein
MENKKKITFAKQDLEKFLKSTDLILKENALRKIAGGDTTYKNYSESTFVNHKN